MKRKFYKRHHEIKNDIERSILKNYSKDELNYTYEEFKKYKTIKEVRQNSLNELNSKKESCYEIDFYILTTIEDIKLMNYYS